MTTQKNQQLVGEDFHPSFSPFHDTTARAALDFVSIGVGCFAFTLIESVGIVSCLVEKGYFEEEQLNDVKKFKNVAAVKASLLSLCLCKILTKKSQRYFLTELGEQLASHVGLVTMVFDGYGELMAKGVQVALNKVSRPEKYLNGAAIALSSIQFGEKVDNILIEFIKELNLKGTICDLGCGSADRLLKLCKATSVPGLGLDSSQEAVKIARKAAQGSSLVHIEHADAAELSGVWEDVQLLMQSFMTHDFYPDIRFIDSLSSYRKNFPNLKYFLVVDIVAPEDSLVSHMPAYDYVHGLLGIETRRYGHFISLFVEAGYEIAKEIPIDMPNTYLWVLKPTT